MDPALQTMIGGVARSDWPALRCPVCGRGSLDLAEADAQMPWSGATERFMEVVGDPEHIRGQYLFVLRCQAAVCAEVVVSAGDMWVDQVPVSGSSLPYETFVRPRYFSPPLPIIDLPDATPDPVRDAVTEASAVFWMDPAAAANKLRSAVDRILDDQRVPKTTTKNGKRTHLKTHARCEKLRRTKPDLADQLLAVKWIGNEGSHAKPVTHQGVLDGARVLRAAVRLVWDDEDTEVRRIVAQVNKRKGIT